MASDSSDTPRRPRHTPSHEAEPVLRTRVPVAGPSWVSIDVYGEPAGPAIVMVPGVMSDAAAWRRVARALTGWPTAVVVNRRGRSPSGPLTDAYSLELEVQDVEAVLAEVADVRALFGWSYGGLIALHVADRLTVPRVIAYEPVVRPFAAHALPALRNAHEARDWDEAVRAVTQDISGLDATAVAGLRADPRVWDALTRLSRPVYLETAALNAAPLPRALARRAGRVDLVVGELNRGRPPYGTSFTDVHRLVPGARVHDLPGQGHMAHLEAPRALAQLIDRLGAEPAPSSGTALG